VRAALFAVPCAGRAGHSAAAGVRAGPGPLRFRVCHGGVVLVPARTCWFPWWPGSARYPSRRWRAQRALGPGKGPEGVRGNRGNRGFGGFPGFPWRLAGFRVRQVRRGMRGRCRALSPVIYAAGSVVAFWGGRNGGLGENLEPGRLGAPGGFRVFPQCVSGLVSPFVCSLVE